MAYEFLYLDYETYSLVDLKEVGLDNYVKHPSTGISMLGWALDEEEVEIWLPHLGHPPKKLLDAMRDPKILKIAWHVPFEFNITNRIFGPRHVQGGLEIPIHEWRDPIVLAHNLSLPGKLDSVASILKMKDQKDPRGDELKFMFCQPVSKGGEMTLFGVAPPLFRDHTSHPREFAEYIEYCKQDVRAERGLWNRLRQIPFPEWCWQAWLLDQKINQFGMPGRRDLGEKGLRLARRFIDEIQKFLKEKTGLENPNSDIQMKAWAAERGYPWNSMRANTVRAEISDPNSKCTPECKEVLSRRLAARKSSYTKLEKFLSLLSEDDRLRYQFNFMGAARTGRWKSGGGEDTSMQVQNLSRGEKAVKKKLALAIDLLDREDYDGIVREFANAKNPKDSVTVVEFVITLMRSLFQAKAGKKLIVSDKNAIENRMLGWAAGCPAILNVFKTCNDCGHLNEQLTGSFLCIKCGSLKPRCPYISFGTRLFNKDYAQMYQEYVKEITEDRQNSKPAVLGAGYCLGGGEMYINEYGDEVRGGLWGYALNVCGVDMPKELAHKAVKIFREAYPEVVQFWTDLEEAFKQVFKRGGCIKVGEVTWNKQTKEWVEHPTQGKQCVITFRRIKMPDGGYSIRMELPSGRALHYLNVSIEEEQRTSQKTGNPYTNYTLFYDGVEHSATQGADGKNVKKRHKWGRVKTYGGKICLGASTRVVTPSGIKRLDQISLDDLVWDGVQWVQHGGLICNGLRETQTWMGLTGTPDHQILGGSEWHELGKTTNRNGLCSLLTGLASALRLWCSLNPENGVDLACGATVDRSLTWIREHFVETKSITAPPAGVKPDKPEEQNVLDTTSFWIESFATYGCENSQTFSLGATTKNAKRTPTTGAEESSVMSRGGKAEAFGLNTPLHFQDGITLLLNWIELTTTEIMNREISGLSLAERICKIGALLSGLPWAENSIPTKSFASDLLRFGARALSAIISSADALLNGASPNTSIQKVYDLRNCGPLHRFMVLTDAGPVLVHNCENAIQAMSFDDLVHSLFLADEMGFDLWGVFHDEGATEVDDDPFGLRLSDLNWCMVQIPWWAPGFIAGAEGYESKVYKKG